LRLLSVEYRVLHTLHMNKPSLRSSQRLSTKARLVVYSSSILIIAAALTYVLNFGSSKSTLAVAGQHGSKIVSTSNVILNEYTTLSNDAAVGATTITVASSSLNANGRFASGLAAGELVMIIQMQGATISTSNNSSYGSVTNYNNCGNHEFAEVLSVPSSTTINLTVGLKKSYTATGGVQVIRVPRYSSFTVNNGASVTCPAWNGSTGGIVAIESNGTTNINGTINVTGKGFRGGATEQNTNTPGDHTSYRSTNAIDGAEKGEGIAGLSSSLSGGRYGRGAPANGGGGGNSHNGGGGGGANAGTGTWNGGGIPDVSLTTWRTAWDLEGGSFSTNNSPGGGRGGYTWSFDFRDPITVGPGNAVWAGDNRYNMGGFGGRVLDYSTGRIFMGGGGGAGDSNNGVATPGGVGGGIAFIISAGIVDGTGSITANGSSVPLSSGAPGDASGGGGGGGTIIIYTSGANVKNLTLNANGGTGGSQSLNSGAEVEGPGGGGGGGYISTTSAFSLTRTVSGAANGQTDAPPMAAFPPNGATKGAPGIITTLPLSPYSGVNSLPVELLAFTAKQNGDQVLVTWTTASERNNDYFTIEKSKDGRNFVMLGRVDGAGNSITARNYHLPDVNPNKGHNYYRLTQTDFNGEFETFNSVHVLFKGQSKSAELKSVYPNPFSDILSVSYYTATSSAIRFKLINSAGQEVKSMVVQSETGSSTVEWKNLSSLPPGNYMIIMDNNQEKIAGKTLIKEK